MSSGIGGGATSTTTTTTTTTTIAVAATGEGIRAQHPHQDEMQAGNPSTSTKKKDELRNIEIELTKAREEYRRLLIRTTRGLVRRSKEAETMRLKMLDELKVLVDGNAENSVIATKIEAYKHLYSDFGDLREAKIRFHANQIRNLLIPTQVSRTISALLQFRDLRDNGIEDPSQAEVKLIHDQLSKELNLSIEQERSFLGVKEDFDHQHSTMIQSLELLDKLEILTKIKNTNMNENVIGLINKVVTPKQQAKYLLFLEKNKAMVYLLNPQWQDVANQASSSNSMTKASSVGSAETSRKLSRNFGGSFMTLHSAGGDSESNNNFEDDFLNVFDQDEDKHQQLQDNNKRQKN